MASGGQASCEFDSAAIGEGVTLGFLHLHENIFLRIASLRILNAGVDLIENAEIVELGLSARISC